MPALVSGQFDLLENFSQQSKWEIEVIGSVTYQGIKLVILNYPFQISLQYQSGSKCLSPRNVLIFQNPKKKKKSY